MDNSPLQTRLGGYYRSININILRMEKEKFDPKDEQYKEVADLPPEHQEEFMNVEGGGFVSESAILNTKEAEKMAREENDLRFKLQEEALLNSKAGQERIHLEGGYYGQHSDEFQKKAEKEVEKIMQNSKLTFGSKFIGYNSDTKEFEDNLVRTVEGMVGDKRIFLEERRKAGRATEEVGGFGEGYYSRNEKIWYSGEVNGEKIDGDTAKKLYKEYEPIARLQQIDKEVDPEEKMRREKDWTRYFGHPGIEVRKGKKEEAERYAKQKKESEEMKEILDKKYPGGFWNG